MLDLNPLDVLNQIFLKFIPPHFAKMRLSKIDFQINEIKDWIDVKCKNRYSISKLPQIDENGKLNVSVFVGFEDHKELTFFMLGCPFIRRNQ